MKTLSAFVVRWPWLVILLVVGTALLFLVPLTGIEIDPEIKNQLPEDMPARQNVAAIEGKFGGSEIVMIVVQADDVLAPATLARIQKIGEALAEVPTVDQVVSPFTLTDIRGDPSGMMQVEPAIASLPTDEAEREALRERLRANELVFGNVLAKDFTAASIIGMLSTQAKDSETTAAIQAVIDSAPGPETVVVGGMPTVRTHVSEDIRSDVRRFAPVGMVLIIGFLFVTLRQFRGVFVPFSTQLLSIILAMGMIPLLGWKMQMVTVTLPVILLAVGNDHTVHLVSLYQEMNKPGNKMTGPELAQRVLSHLGVPVIAAGTTTAAGLLCLTTHIVVPAAQLGVLACVGVLFATIASVTYAPAVLAVLPVAKPLKGVGERDKGQWLDRFLHQGAAIVVRYRKATVGSILGFAALVSLGIPLLTVDTNPINYYPEEAPVAATARLINSHFGGSTEIAVMVEGDIQDPAVLRKIDRLQTELQAMPQVGYTISIAEVVKTMNRAVSGNDPAKYTIPESREQVAQLFVLYSMGGDTAAFERMVDFDYKYALVTARVNSLSTDDIAAVVDKAHHLANTELAGMTVVVGGFGAVFSELVDAIVQGQIWSLSLSFVVVGLLASISFGSVWGGVFCLIPLTIAVPALFGLMGLAGIELNIVTAMLSSIMIGVGVDYTIHYLWRYREERFNGLEAPAAAIKALITSGRGITFNAMSVIVGFSILFLSNFLPVRFFGFLVVVSIGACLVAALALMPPLVVLLRPKFCEPRD